MDEQKTMMFSFGEDKPKADVVIREVAAAMREKGYNPINQLVGYLLSGDPAYVTSHQDARSRSAVLSAMSCSMNSCASIWSMRSEALFVARHRGCDDRHCCQ